MVSNHRMNRAGLRFSSFFIWQVRLISFSIQTAVGELCCDSWNYQDFPGLLKTLVTGEWTVEQTIVFATAEYLHTFIIK